MSFKIEMGDTVLDSKVPDGPIDEKWTLYKQNAKLVLPANKRKYTIK